MKGKILIFILAISLFLAFQAGYAEAVCDSADLNTDAYTCPAGQEVTPTCAQYISNPYQYCIDTCGGYAGYDSTTKFVYCCCPAEEKSVCGDGICASDESCLGCSSDCGSCPAVECSGNANSCTTVGECFDVNLEVCRECPNNQDFTCDTCGSGTPYWVDHSLVGNHCSICWGGGSSQPDGSGPSNGCPSGFECATSNSGYYCRASCDYLNYECGIHADGGGYSINCGTCSSGYSCSSGKCIIDTCTVSEYCLDTNTVEYSLNDCSTSQTDCAVNSHCFPDPDGGVECRCSKPDEVCSTDADCCSGDGTVCELGFCVPYSAECSVGDTRGTLPDKETCCEDCVEQNGVLYPGWKKWIKLSD